MAELLRNEMADSVTAAPLRLGQRHPGLLVRNLVHNGSYVTILINKNTEAVEAALIFPAPSAKQLQVEILFSEGGGSIRGDGGFHLPPEETLVVRWHTPSFG